MSAMFCFASIPEILAFLRGNQQTSYGTVIFEMQVMQVIGKRRHLLKKISVVFFFTQLLRLKVGILFLL